MPPLSGSWANALKGEFSKDYYKKLFQTVGAEYKTHTIYPPADDIFNAFHARAGKSGHPGPGSVP